MYKLVQACAINECILYYTCIANRAKCVPSQHKHTHTPTTKKKTPPPDRKVMCCDAVRPQPRARLVALLFAYICRYSMALAKRYAGWLAPASPDEINPGLRRCVTQWVFLGYFIQQRRCCVCVCVCNNTPMTCEMAGVYGIRGTKKQRHSITH